MLSKGTYTLVLSDNTEIQMRFCTWTMSRFAELSGGLSYSDLVDMFAGSKLSLKNIQTLLLCGTEYVALRGNKPFVYNDLDASDWIDDMGGVFSPKMAELIMFIAHSLTPATPMTELGESDASDTKKK